MFKIVLVLTFCCLVSIGYGELSLAFEDLLDTIFTTESPSDIAPTTTIGSGESSSAFKDLLDTIFTTESSSDSTTIGSGESSFDPVQFIFGTILTTESPSDIEPTTKIFATESSSDFGPTTTTNSEESPKYCGVDKECVPHYLCDDNEIPSDVSGLIDIRLHGECNYLEKCCDITKKLSKSPPSPASPKLHPDGCGFRNPKGVSFEITGAVHGETQFGEFPWMVALLREEVVANEILNIYECGGAVIAPTFVLTAAHCVHLLKAETLVVRAGEWDSQTNSEVLPHQDRRVKEIIVHEKYHKGALYNDVALLILESPFVWQENVRPICLPDPSANFDYSRCYATGWGKDKFGKDGVYQVILKKIDLPIMPNDQCQKNLRTTRLGKHFNLDPSFICAGGEKGKDTCKGDGGSPLVCPMPGVKDRFYQAGIVAWGIGCGEENIPGIYANVPYLRPWITDKLTQRGIDFTHFTP